VAAPRVSADAIVRIDDITLAPGHRGHFVDLLRSQYVPGAQARGLELVDIALTPPVDAPDLETHVVIIWRLAGVDAFWHARRAAMTDPSVPAFWDGTADLVTRRTRRFEQSSLRAGSIEDDPAAALPSRGVHYIVLLNLADDTEPVLEPPCKVRRSCFGRHLPGTVGRPDASWELDADEPLAIDAVAVTGANVADVVVFGDVVGAGARAPGLRDGIKRTLLLMVDEHSRRAAVGAFERDLLAMPRHIPAIRNWRLARVASSQGGWTHAWEQEYAGLSGLRDDYMRSPYHWGVVDGWFDAEDPRCIVAPELLHLFYEAAASVLAPGDGDEPPSRDPFDFAPDGSPVSSDMSAQRPCARAADL